MILSNRFVGLFILINMGVLCHTYPDNSAIQYPESGEEDDGRIADNRPQDKPTVLAPSKYRDGEYLYPDQVGFWVCDCKTGPCNSGEYLILRNNAVIPECVRNPCIHDGYVPFANGCYALDKPGPCPVPELANVIGVDKTLKLTCTKRSKFIERPTTGDCFFGGVRWNKGQCPYQ